MPTTDIYVRISDDKTGQAAGVERQESECRALAQRLGLNVHTVYTDNDLSATSGVRRPAFEALLRDKPANLIVWHTDRLVRTSKDLERVLDLGLTVHAVTAGTLDLSTASGRGHARIGTAIAQMETEHKGERQVSANRQRAEAGLPYWRRRPFGFEVDGAHRPEEAAAIRAGAQMLLEGATLAAVRRRFVADGVAPASGSPEWSLTALRQMFLAPRLAGLLTYRGDVIGAGTWAPILDEAIWNGVVSVLRNPARLSRMSEGASKLTQWLSGIATCGTCGEPLYSSATRKIADGTRPRGYRCNAGHVNRRVHLVDTDVLDYVLRVLSLDTARAVLTEGAKTDVSALHVERAQVEAKRTEWLQSGMSPRDVATALVPLDARLRSLDAAVLAATTDDVFAPFLAAATDWHSQRAAGHAIWADLPLHQRRAIIRALTASIVLTAGVPDVQIAPGEIALRIIGDAGAWFARTI
jgi:DNA invertase Pin-like site-specific DNA recombinase